MGGIGQTRAGGGDTAISGNRGGEWPARITQATHAACTGWILPRRLAHINNALHKKRCRNADYDPAGDDMGPQPTARK